jgi:hypothetical protein
MEPVLRHDAPVIDIGHALDLLAAAVRERDAALVYVGGVRQPGPAESDGEPRRLVGRALSLEQVPNDDLLQVDDLGVRELARRGSLPVQLTLGALVVLDAAQRAQDRGSAWGDALDHAINAATRFLALIPDCAFGVLGTA